MPSALTQRAILDEGADHRRGSLYQRGTVETRGERRTLRVLCLFINCSNIDVRADSIFRACCCGTARPVDPRTAREEPPANNADADAGE